MNFSAGANVGRTLLPRQQRQRLLQRLLPLNLSPSNNFPFRSNKRPCPKTFRDAHSKLHRSWKTFPVNLTSLVVASISLSRIIVQFITHQEYNVDGIQLRLRPQLFTKLHYTTVQRLILKRKKITKRKALSFFRFFLCSFFLGQKSSTVWTFGNKDRLETIIQHINNLSGTLVC